MIKNSGLLFAMILYTGQDSKIMLNQGRYKIKKSQVEKKLHLLTFVNILILLLLDLLMCGLNYHFMVENSWGMRYNWSRKSLAKTGIDATAWKTTRKLIATYYLLFNQLIPLTLVVLLEMGKVHFTRNMENDADMMYEDYTIKAPRGCSVQNLSIHEELGQITNIFSDKTGTLT